jgi:hypothetical protein
VVYLTVYIVVKLLWFLHSEIKSGIAKYNSGDQNNEMGRACGMYGRQERCTQGFGEGKRALG